MADDVAPRARPGRPRDPAKRRALLEAAQTLFLRHGADAVTLDQVIAAAHVSRATFYSNFADKTALLAAVIDAQSQRIATDAWAEEVLSTDIATALIASGERLMTFLAEPDTFAYERLVAQAALAEPHHGIRFFAAGPGRARGIVMRLIEAAQRHGEIVPADPRAAADDLIGLWRGCWRLEVNFGGRPVPKPEELRGLARHGVEQFVRLYGA